MIVTGDSLAVGIAAALHTRSAAAVGRSSREGTAIIRRLPDTRLIVSLGANDADSDPRFRARIRLVLQGRRCVAWVAVTRKPRLDRILREETERDRRLRRVSLHGIPRADGVHPRSYETLARRAEAACTARP